MILAIDVAISAALGVLAGGLELVKRYGDPPLVAFRTTAGWAYLLINGVAAGAALGLTRILGWEPNQTDQAAARVLQILAAGFGAFSVLRTSVYSVKVGDSTENASPSTFLRGVVDAADRQVAQKYGKFLADQSKKLSAGLKFSEVRVALPVVILSLEQSSASVDETELAREINALHESADLTDGQKLVVLVMSLFRKFGYQVTAAALEVVRDP